MAVACDCNGALGVRAAHTPLMVVEAVTIGYTLSLLDRQTSSFEASLGLLSFSPLKRAVCHSFLSQNLGEPHTDTRIRSSYIYTHARPDRSINHNQRPSSAQSSTWSEGSSCQGSIDSIGLIDKRDGPPPPLPAMLRTQHSKAHLVGEGAGLLERALLARERHGVQDTPLRGEEDVVQGLAEALARILHH